MNRRQIMLAGASAVAPFGLGMVGVRAQAGMDAMKLPILAGGDYATMTSKLALRRANSSSVTAFAKLEIEEQAAVADAFGSRPGAAGLLPKHAGLLQALEAAPDAEFDALYVQGQIAGHRELLALHKSYARRGADPTAQGASTVAVPSIGTHLAMLRTLAKLA
jgi:putative membrane protein